MKHVNATGKAVLDALASHVKEPGDSYRMERTSYMPLVISRLTSNIYSLGHYYEQMGDLMADPEMEFLHGGDGEWYPFSYLQHGLGVMRVAAEIERGQVKRFKVREQADMANFANGWLKNVKSQFDVRAKSKRTVKPNPLHVVGGDDVSVLLVTEGAFGPAARDFVHREAVRRGGEEIGSGFHLESGRSDVQYGFATRALATAFKEAVKKRYPQFAIDVIVSRKRAPVARDYSVLTPAYLAEAAGEYERFRMTPKRLQTFVAGLASGLDDKRAATAAGIPASQALGYSVYVKLMLSEKSGRVQDD